MTTIFILNTKHINQDMALLFDLEPLVLAIENLAKSNDGTMWTVLGMLGASLFSVGVAAWIHKKDLKAKRNEYWIDNKRDLYFENLGFILLCIDLLQKVTTEPHKCDARSGQVSNSFLLIAKLKVTLGESHNIVIAFTEFIQKFNDYYNHSYDKMLPLVTDIINTENALKKSLDINQ